MLARVHRHLLAAALPTTPMSTHLKWEVSTSRSVPTVGDPPPPGAEHRMWPAIEITKSGNRKEEKLFSRTVMPKINTLRRGLAGVKPMEAMRLLLKGLDATDTNEQFLAKMETK